VPADFGGRSEKAGVKNRDDRLIVLNEVAKSIIESQRGLSDKWVFPYRGQPLNRMHDSGWCNARRRSGKVWREEFGSALHPGFERVKVHDLKHIFGRRLRAAGMSFEDRQALAWPQIRQRHNALFICRAGRVDRKSQSGRFDSPKRAGIDPAPPKWDSMRNRVEVTQSKKRPL